MSRHAAVVIATAGLILISIAGGCAGTPAADDAASRLRLVVEDRDAAIGRFMRYEVDGDGGLRVGAGREAQRNEASEAPPLAAADLDRLVESMRAAGWLGASFPASVGSGPRRIVVSIRTEALDRRFTELADGRVFPAGTSAVLGELEGFARRRFGAVLDGLPKGQ